MIEIVMAVGIYVFSIFLVVLGYSLGMIFMVRRLVLYLVIQCPFHQMAQKMSLGLFIIMQMAVTACIHVFIRSFVVLGYRLGMILMVQWMVLSLVLMYPYHHIAQELY